MEPWGTSSTLKYSLCLFLFIQPIFELILLFFRRIFHIEHNFSKFRSWINSNMRFDIFNAFYSDREINVCLPHYHCYKNGGIFRFIFRSLCMPRIPDSTFGTIISYLDKIPEAVLYLWWQPVPTVAADGYLSGFDTSSSEVSIWRNFWLSYTLYFRWRATSFILEWRGGIFYC